MALRLTTQQFSKGLSRRAAAPLGLSQLANHARHLATPVHPVTQDATGSKGPTAMVFLNMGGPSTLNEVGDFLSRLFVCIIESDTPFNANALANRKAEYTRLMAT